MQAVLDQFDTPDAQREGLARLFRGSVFFGGGQFEQAGQVELAVLGE